MDLLRYVDAPLAGALLALGVLAVLVLDAAGRRGADVSCVRAWTALGTCVSVVLVLALSGGRAGRRAVNLVPLRTVVEQAHNPDVRLLVVNLAGNVVCFVPLGLLLVRALRRGAVGATVVGTAFCAAVEAVQYGLGRTADVDDVLLNGVGVALGAWVAARAGRTRRRDREPVPAASRSDVRVSASTTPGSSSSSGPGRGHGSARPRSGP